MAESTWRSAGVRTVGAAFNGTSLAAFWNVTDPDTGSNTLCPNTECVHGVTRSIVTDAGAGAPVVRVRAGSVVGWDWRGNESHNVTIRSGPDHVDTRFKSGGMFAHRFTRAGTYRIVCSLHSPGMGMTLVVS